jgi:HAD superfamily hydrolase (TIGR01490 family)
METENGYIVFLDLDRTLTGINSGYAIVRTALRKGLMSRKAVSGFMMLAILYKLGIMNSERMISYMGTWLHGISRDEFSALADETVRSLIIEEIFSEAYSEIEFHRNRNASFAILSSALNEICLPVARHLGISYVIATEMETTGNTFTGKPKEGFCFGNSKRERLIEFCEINGYNPEFAYYYADSHSDIPALEAVGNPVCINPDRKLMRAAGKMKWPVIKWNKHA